jgi:hypothetical protein
MNRITAAAISAALIVAGCATSNLPSVDPLPLDYRKLARDHVWDHFPNPHNIRDAQIAAPRSISGWALAEAEQQDYWAVCLRTKTNGKSGARSDAKDMVLLIRGNQVMDAHEDAAWTSFCKGAQFEPFPEIRQGA